MIEVRNLQKAYGKHLAIRDLSFIIEQGGVYGFLGPNGAGKSTTLNILTGCLAPTSGEIIINGYDMIKQPKKAKQSIGYLPEIPPLYTGMTPREFLMFVAEAKGIVRTQRKSQVDIAMERTQIVNVRNRQIMQLSKGYRQRVGIAQTILGSPPIVILDEPTVGLDPRQITEVRDLIVKLGKESTVLLSSHILPEIRSICKHILILSKGELVASDTPEKLEQQYEGGHEVRLLARAPKEKAMDTLQRLDGVQISEMDQQENGLLRVCVRAGYDISELIFYAFSEIRCPIVEMQRSRVNLETIFLQLTSDADREDADGGEKV